MRGMPRSHHCDVAVHVGDRHARASALLEPRRPSGRCSSQDAVGSSNSASCRCAVGRLPVASPTTRTARQACETHGSVRGDARVNSRYRMRRRCGGWRALQIFRDSCIRTAMTHCVAAVAREAPVAVGDGAARQACALRGERERVRIAPSGIDPWSVRHLAGPAGPRGAPRTSDAVTPWSTCRASARESPRTSAHRIVRRAETLGAPPRQCAGVR
jgi:hypothetical protein